MRIIFTLQRTQIIRTRDTRLLVAQLGYLQPIAQVLLITRHKKRVTTARIRRLMIIIRITTRINPRMNAGRHTGSDSRRNPRNPEAVTGRINRFMSAHFLVPKRRILPPIVIITARHKSNVNFGNLVYD